MPRAGCNIKEYFDYLCSKGYEQIYNDIQTEKQAYQLRKQHPFSFCQGSGVTLWPGHELQTDTSPVEYCRGGHCSGNTVPEGQ